jgi:hypothetical protein
LLIYLRCRTGRSRVVVSKMEAILEALDREPLVAVRAALRAPAAFDRLIKAKYQPPENEGDESPDSQESQESAEVDEKRLSAAAEKWAQLNEQERQAVLAAAERLYGPSQSEELADLLNLRVS